MKKFISKENLQTYHNLLKPEVDKKLDAPEGGSNGQVLTKTEDSIEWADIPEGITNEDVEKAIDEALYESTVEYVDLGLPSGLLWATCNLGAEKETDYGLYFQWGNIQGYKGACSEIESDGNEDAHYFNWSKYKFGGDWDGGQNKYNNEDNLKVLESEDDAATIMLRSQ